MSFTPMRKSSISRARDKSPESEMGPHLFDGAFFTLQCTFCFSESGLDSIIVPVAPWNTLLYIFLPLTFDP